MMNTNEIKTMDDATKLKMIELVMNSNLSDEDKLYEIKLITSGARTINKIESIVRKANK